jgi:hypothetical protein
MIVPRYYEDLSVLHETQCQPEPIIFRHPEEWIIWWSTGKSQTECSY